MQAFNSHGNQGKECFFARLCKVTTLIAILSTGCSLAFTRPPPPKYETMTTVECTDGKILPTLDLLFTAIQALPVAVALNASDADYQDFPLSRGADLGFGLALGALGLASTIHGYEVVGERRAAKEKVQQNGNAHQPWNGESGRFASCTPAPGR
jgi:hypothetical protein